ncbi:related to PTC7 - 2C protein phosphatase [Cephalotrichum gorgonifer]|uniref:Protein phosphatase n=1 Tax=Cephalotrichum gorgonifer TaxID=2041049 RepID=A0AAE8MNJ4_9PEZI|nr:related to PTC7 - 2C protein phosphatase [Cephalotrichum gorgonifer]
MKFTSRTNFLPTGFKARLSSHIRPTAPNHAPAPRHPYVTTGTGPGAGRPPMAPKPRFSYDVAASFIGKGLPYDPATHVYQYNPYHRVQRAKKSKRSRPQSGHDAFFVSRVGDTGAVALGVTDGVGGWVESNVDPADFSHAFCDYMAARAYYHGVADPDHQQPPQTRVAEDGCKNKSGNGNGNGETLSARRLMERGYSDVLHDRSIHAGGSTACVGILSPDGTLDAANLGDSGYLILRLNGVHSYSQPQTHAFNTPFQLSVIPPSLLTRMTTFGGRGVCDLPRDADVTHKSLQHGDVLVFGTDGLWDNLFNQDVLHIASRVMVAAGAWQMAEGGYIRPAADLSRFTAPPAPSLRDDAAPTTTPPSPPPPTPTPAAEQPPARTLQSALAVAITSAARAASLDKKTLSPFGKEVHAAYPNERWDGGKVDDICVVVAVVSEDNTSPIKARL